MSRQFAVGAALLAAVSGPPLVQPPRTMPAQVQLRVVDTIQGTTYRVVEAALAVFERAGTDVSRYVVSVVDDGTPVVLFRAHDARDGVRGAVGVRHGSGTELSPDELQTVLTRADRHKELPLIQGGNLLPVRVAVAVFQQRIPDLTPYKITVVRGGESVVAIFTDKTAELRGRGSPGARPGFEVEMDARDLRVVRSNFVR